MPATRYARSVAAAAALAVMVGAVATTAHWRPLIKVMASRPMTHTASVAVHKKATKRAHVKAHKRAVARAQQKQALPIIGPDANLQGKSIEMDAGNNGANAYPFSSRSSVGIYDSVNFPNDNLYKFLNLGALDQTAPADIITNLENNNNPTIIDWVKDMLPNTDPASLQNDLAEGILLNSNSEDANGNNAQTGAGDPTQANHPARGHWYGQRIVDGIGTDEHDIFIKGGKENDPASWNVGPGSVGSSKYDITQAFLANTTYATTDTVDFPSGFKDLLFFGMERSGNNGTTAFDFEFDQNPPTGDYIPNRTDGDVLFTFEMQGSSTNKALPHIYVYKSSIPGFDLSHDLAGTLGPYNPMSSMNFGNTPSAPWGHVNSKGQWAVEQIPNAEFCEAAAFYGPDTGVILPFISRCGGNAYVQIRTRSSTTDTSDLKDTTKFFMYQFPQPVAVPAARTICEQGFYFNGTGSHGSVQNAALTYNWKFTVSDPNVTLTGDGFTLTPHGGGVYTSPAFADGAERHVLASGLSEAGADVVVQLTVVESGTCQNTQTLNSFHISPDLAAAAPTLTGSCSSRTLNFSGLITGGTAPISYEWDVYKDGSANPVYTTTGSSNTVHVSTSGSFTPSSDGQYYAVLKAHDARFDPNNPSVCSIAPQSVDVCAYGAINAVASKKSADGTNQKVTVHAAFLDVSAACGSSTIQWQIFQNGSWSNIGGASTADFDYTTFETDDASPAATSFAIGGDNYVGKVFTVQLRVHVTRSINGGQCSSDSAPITLKKVIAVDP